MAKKPKLAPKATVKAAARDARPKALPAKPKAVKAKLAKPKATKRKAKVLAPALLPAKPAPEAPRATAAVMDRLFAVVTERRTADPAQSHSARLLGRGPAKVAQKFGEEAVECLIEAVSGNTDALVAESADVLYHLLVMWVAAGVTPDQVWAELERREGVSGVVEKASRALPIVGTTKIP